MGLLPDKPLFAPGKIRYSCYLHRVRKCVTLLLLAHLSHSCFTDGHLTAVMHLPPQTGI